MKKLSVLSFILSAILVGSLSANEVNDNDKKVFINVDSKGGTEILTSELEYKQYLDKKLDFSLREQERINKLEAQCNQISNLKLAVAKLIKLNETTDNKSNTELTNEVKFLKAEIDKASKSNEILKLENEKFRTDLLNLNNAINKLSNQNIVVKAVTTPVKEIKKETTVAPVLNIAPEKTAAPSCKTKTILDIDKEELSHSYFKFKEHKQFTISSINNVDIFEYPLVEVQPTGDKVLKGEKYYADMYTAGGWVHFVDKGWVKGYLLYPQVNPIDVSDKKSSEIPKSTIIKKIDIKDCNK